MNKRTEEEAKAVAILVNGFARGTKVYKSAPEQRVSGCVGCALNTHRGGCVTKSEVPELCGSDDGNGVIWIEVP